ncbi:MAG: Uma2 family endonuclease [Bacteroidota bacterium]
METVTAQRAATVLPTPFPGEALAFLKDIGPYELVRGAIVPMSPTGWFHGLVASALVARLQAFATERGGLHVLSGEVGVYTERDPDTVRGMDVAVISRERLAQVDTASGFLDVLPEVVIEVVSPGNPAEEMTTKTREYLAAGAEQVWIVRPQRRTIATHSADSSTETWTAADTLHGRGALVGLTLSIADLFVRA